MMHCSDDIRKAYRVICKKIGAYKIEMTLLEGLIAWTSSGMCRFWKLGKAGTQLGKAGTYVVRCAVRARFSSYAKYIAFGWLDERLKMKAVVNELLRACSSEAIVANGIELKKGLSLEELAVEGDLDEA